MHAREHVWAAGACPGGCGATARTARRQAAALRHHDMPPTATRRPSHPPYGGLSMTSSRYSRMRLMEGGERILREKTFPFPERPSREGRAAMRSMRRDSVVAMQKPVEVESRSALDEILRQGARCMVQAAVEAEPADYVEHHAGPTDAHMRRRLLLRNGHQPGAASSPASARSRSRCPACWTAGRTAHQTLRVASPPTSAVLVLRHPLHALDTRRCPGRSPPSPAYLPAAFRLLPFAAALLRPSRGPARSPLCSTPPVGAAP
jgi:hypothetical protein